MDKKTQDALDALKVQGTPLAHIRNKNEQRVVEAMIRILPEFDGYKPNKLDLEDIYALSLNTLPARYIQRGSIVLREPVREEVIEEVVRDAVLTVQNRPNYNA
ncbi:late competence development ComFB family protein [Desulfobaculum senezii]|jgi:hypothetical protein